MDEEIINKDDEEQNKLLDKIKDRWKSFSNLYKLLFLCLIFIFT